MKASWNSLFSNWIFTFIFLASVSLSYGQSSAQRDTVMTSNGMAEVSYIISTDLSQFDILEISQEIIDSNDTLTVFYGSYSIDEDDPSAFRTFSVDETNNKIFLSTGLFDPEELHTTILITNSSGDEEEIVIN